MPAGKPAGVEGESRWDVGPGSQSERILRMYAAVYNALVSFNGRHDGRNKPDE